MNVSRSCFFSFLAILAGTVVITSGCGDGRPSCVPVSGQVLLDGKPLPEGFVRVVPEQGRAATGKLNAEGRFALTTYETNDGCILGKHAVEVVSYDTSNPRVFQSLIPDKYLKAATSGLSVTIEEPTDSLTLNLSSKGKRTRRRIINAGESDPAKAL